MQGNHKAIKLRVITLASVAIILAIISVVMAIRARAAEVSAAGAQISAAAPNAPLSWITLGTASGPITNAQRSQPANLLVVNGKPWIVDCGDGAMERLAGAGFKPSQVDTAFISHLHMDHIGGLQGLIGLRWFTGAKDMLTIYGPPGTDAVVAGILQSLKPSEEIGLGVPVQTPTPEQQTRVVIVKDGSDFNVDGVRVRAVRNSHFDGPLGKPAENGSQSLSYRFDYNSYAIGFTGDTGPSEAVARLEKGADLLVSEVMDKPVMNELFMKNALDVPMKVKSAIVEHFNTQHLSPQEAGKIAEESGARRLVFTHLGIPGPTDAETPKLVSEAHETFKGEVIVAHDLDRF